MKQAYKYSRGRRSRKPGYKKWHERVVMARNYFPFTLVKVSISNNRGALVIWGKPGHKGRAVSLWGYPSDNRTKHLRYDASFVPYQYDSACPVIYAAVFNRVVPGNFYIATHFSENTFSPVSIAPGIVTHIDWT